MLVISKLDVMALARKLGRQAICGDSTTTDMHPPLPPRKSRQSIVYRCYHLLFITRGHIDHTKEDFTCPPPPQTPGEMSRTVYALIQCHCLCEPSSRSAINGVRRRACDTPFCMASCIVAMPFSTIRWRKAWCPGVEVKELCRRMCSTIAPIEVHMRNPVYTSTKHDKMATSASVTGTLMNSMLLPATSSAHLGALGHNSRYHLGQWRRKLSRVSKFHVPMPYHVAQVAFQHFPTPCHLVGYPHVYVDAEFFPDLP